MNIIVKADVQGSVEAVCQSLEKLSNDEVRVNIIHSGVGGITESDIMLASASNAIIIGFNVLPDGNNRIGKNEKVEIRTYRIIYQAIEEIEAAMKGMLEPTYREMLPVKGGSPDFALGVGHQDVMCRRQIARNNEIWIMRDSVVIHEGRLSSL